MPITNSEPCLIPAIARLADEWPANRYVAYLRSTVAASLAAIRRE